MTKKSAISRSQCGLMIDGLDLDVGLIGKSWIQVGHYKESSLVDESPSIHLILPPVIISIMPAQHTFSSISSASQATLCQQYEADLQRSAVGFNAHGRMYVRRGDDFYPTLEEVHNRSNTAVPDDDEFEDSGLNHFIIAQRCIARHRLGRRRDFMSVYARGLISRGVEDWDMEDEPHSGEVEVGIGYAAAVGMATIESDVMLNDRVSSCFVLITSVLILHR